MEFVEEARAAAEGARAAYRGRVAQAERSFLEARETRVESERSLGDALGSALLIARSKSLRLYPDRIECKGEAIRLGEVLGIDAEMEEMCIRDSLCSSHGRPAPRRMHRGRMRRDAPGKANGPRSTKAALLRGFRMHRTNGGRILLGRFLFLLGSGFLGLFSRLLDSLVGLRLVGSLRCV